MHDRQSGRITPGLTLALVVGLLAATSLPLYRHLYVRGLQAEVMLMSSYLQTLLNAHQIEHGRYIGFEEFYGAPIAGQDRCLRPDGAVELGFKLRWCQSGGLGEPIRYAYRVLVEEDSYRIEAVSGSDDKLHSFVCFSDADEVWHTQSEGPPTATQSCSGLRVLYPPNNPRVSQWNQQSSLTPNSSVTASQ